MSHVRVLIAANAFVLLAACGLLGPTIECRGIARKACDDAVEIAEQQVDRRVGPRSWFEEQGPSRIVVDLGCGDRPCPPSAAQTAISVTFYPSDGGLPLYTRFPRSEVGL
jgi:hypothetical protein